MNKKLMWLQDPRCENIWQCLVHPTEQQPAANWRPVMNSSLSPNVRSAAIQLPPHDYSCQLIYSVAEQGTRSELSHSHLRSNFPVYVHAASGSKSLYGHRDALCFHIFTKSCSWSSSTKMLSHFDVPAKRIRSVFWFLFHCGNADVTFCSSWILIKCSSHMLL